MAPEVATDPLGGQAVKLHVGTTFGDRSWMWLPLADPIQVADHNAITVRFDIYRYDYGPTPEPYTQNLFWMWVDENDLALAVTDGMMPSWGAQWDLSRTTYPFGWDDGRPDRPTIFGDYATVEMTWDLDTMTASSMYDGMNVNFEPIFNVPDTIEGFDITLEHGSDTGRGPDSVWIDNFEIIGSDIYNSYGFENFEPGPLHGQDGWVGGTELGPGGTVPEPCTAFATALGVSAVAAALRRRIRRRS